MMSGIKQMSVTVTGGAFVNAAPPAPAVHQVAKIEPLPMKARPLPEVQK